MENYQLIELYSGITFNPDYLSVEYMAESVYSNRASLTFYDYKTRQLAYRKAASPEEVTFLKQHHPEVFNRGGPKP